MNTPFHKFFRALSSTNARLHDGFKVVSFVDNPQFENLVMFRRQDIPDKYQPSRALLMNHFRMAVLLNMKGSAGFPNWDEDIPPGCDDVAMISESEQGKLLFETELANRLDYLIT